MKSNYKNRAKTSTAADFAGLFMVFIGLVLLVYLIIENYMGYTGIKTWMNSGNPSEISRNK